MAPTPDSGETLLLRQPAISSNRLAFVHAGDLWLAELDGNNPQRLTAQKGSKSSPRFSPDGRWIAFSGNYDGNTSVYVMPASGGSPQRVTYHPRADQVRGWSPDGRILFSSARDSITPRVNRLFTIAPTGGLPEALPMQSAERGAFSPDGRRLAYTPFPDAFWTWKRYRGGMTTPIWILDLDTFDHIEIPHANASDTFPCWVDDAIFFLSDRNGVMNVFRYDLNDTRVTQITHHDDFDVRSLTAYGRRLAYEQGGRIHLYDIDAQRAVMLRLALAADLPYARPRYEKLAPTIQNSAISPTGVRAVFETRGEIVTVPAGKGDIRNLTNSPGVADRDPAWSPDGRSIAYFSDEGGEYALVVSDQKGIEKKTYALGKRLFFYTPTWSPDSKHIAFTDKALNLSYITLATGEVVHVDTDAYDHPDRSLRPAWSPDSAWLVYTRRLPNHLRAVFLYELASGAVHQVSDGMSDAISACFSRDGRLVYFAASVNYGLNTGWLDMSSYERPVNRSLYAIVLRADDPSPLAPESDEEAHRPLPGEEPQADAPGATTPVAVRIDLEGFDQRTVALPVEHGDYSHLQVAEGKLFYLKSTPGRWIDPERGAEGFTLLAYDLKERTSARFADDVTQYSISADGKKVLYRSGKPPRFAIADTEKPPEDDKGLLKLDDATILVDPRAEWQQIFQEAYRIQRDYFYDAGMHGLDWEATVATYRQFLPHVGHRDDLNYVLAELMGELVAGHVFVGMGDIPTQEPVKGGLLGADIELDGDLYRIRRIYPGLNWHPELRAPLTEPGVNVGEGEYILAVNGRELRAPTNFYQVFEQTADRITELTISPTGRSDDARVVTVRPIDDESRLRHWSWVEGNRRKVEELSDGKVAYIYMADTGQTGYEAFNRYYFSQLDKQAVVLDERYNGGGSIADYIIDLLNRPLLSYWATREGGVFTSPNASIFGPKVMIVNELAGSGGDAMPLFFRRRGLGKLVGKRTWGGLIGIYDYPPLIDGGFLTAPRLAIFSPDGEWEVENEGVTPDVEVDMTPKLTIAGHDPQLERAVDIVLAELEAQPVTRRTRPTPVRRAARPGNA